MARHCDGAASRGKTAALAPRTLSKAKTRRTALAGGFFTMIWLALKRLFQRLGQIGPLP